MTRPTKQALERSKSTNLQKYKRTEPNFRNTKADISHANKDFLHDMTKKQTQKAHWKQTKKRVMWWKIDSRLQKDEEKKLRI